MQKPFDIKMMGKRDIATEMVPRGVRPYEDNRFCLSPVTCSLYIK